MASWISRADLLETGETDYSLTFSFDLYNLDNCIIRRAGYNGIQHVQDDGEGFLFAKKA